MSALDAVSRPSLGGSVGRSAYDQKNASPEA